MIIRKQFNFDGMHIVRNCSSDRCKFSMHAHRYIVEVFLSALKLDNGYMIYDFGLMKGNIKEIIKSFDNAVSIWNKDDLNYINTIKNYTNRWIELPISPSAEGYSLMFLTIIDNILRHTYYQNGESASLHVKSVRVHETRTGWAEACVDDILFNKSMPIINLNEIIFSDSIVGGWSDKLMWHKLCTAKNLEPIFFNPKVELQIKE